MNNLVVRSCKHQYNEITFSNNWWNIFVSWRWVDPWKSTKNNQVIINPIRLNEANLKISLWLDNDITIAIESGSNYVNAVIWDPSNNSWDSYNNIKTHKVFYIWLSNMEMFKKELLSIL